MLSGLAVGSRPWPHRFRRGMIALQFSSMDHLRMHSDPGRARFCEYGQNSSVSPCFFSKESKPEHDAEWNPRGNRGSARAYRGISPSVNAVTTAKVEEVRLLTVVFETQMARNCGVPSNLPIRRQFATHPARSSMARVTLADINGVVTSPPGSRCRESPFRQTADNSASSIVAMG